MLTRCAQIILLGQSVKVESGTVKDETWYRVLVGPFSNREQLDRGAEAAGRGRFQQPAAATCRPVSNLYRGALCLYQTRPPYNVRVNLKVGFTRSL